MNPSFGSGSRLLGAPASAILGMPSTIQQQSPSSAGFQPGLLPPAPQGVMGAPPPAPQMPSIPGAQPVPNAMPQAPQMPLGQPAQPQGGPVGIPPGNPEAMMISKEMLKRLGAISKAEEMARTGGVPQ